MRLLFDTDLFCKLGIAGLLPDAAHRIGGDMGNCERLPALPHMLRRGRLRQKLGAAACDALLPIAEQMSVLGQASTTWLEQLQAVEEIDPGEAQIFAAAAEHGAMVISGDKRAMRAIKNIEPFPRALNRRIVVFETVLIALCQGLGIEETRRRVQCLLGIDQVVKICFSNPGTDPQECLRSYFDNLSNELDPLVLWSP